MELIFETHSISLDNEAGIASGWNDVALSGEGRRLAAELGLRHHATLPAAVFASDLRRAVETAELAFGSTGIPVLHDERLRECDYGHLTGMPVARLEAERAGRVTMPFPGGQSYQEVVAAVETFLVEIGEAWAGTRVVVIGHSATKWALDALCMGVPLEESVNAPFDWQPGWLYSVG